jgi:hypothetical protein
MRRSSQGLASATDDEVVHSGSLLSGILAPGLITCATGSAKMSANNFGKAMYFGDSMGAMTSPVMRGYLGASGEVGEDQLSALMVIRDLYNMAQEKYGDQSIGSKTESGASAGQQGERK